MSSWICGSGVWRRDLELRYEVGSLGPTNGNST